MWKVNRGYHMTIYRGFNIVPQRGQYAVMQNGEAIATELFKTEDVAMNWIDAEKRRQRQAGTQGQ